jgi:prophage regulatory protein
MTQKLVRLSRAMDLTSLSRAQLYQRMSEGSFPRPVQLSSRRVAWVEGEVLDFVRARIAERDQSEMETIQ